MHRRKPSLTSLVAFILIISPILYVLSYAPVVRLCEGPDQEFDFSGIVLLPLADEYPLYGPVNWLIDNTPLRKPLFIWSGFWGVRGYFEKSCFARGSDIGNRAPEDDSVRSTVY
jgi:hypothetical protein